MDILFNIAVTNHMRVRMRYFLIKRSLKLVLVISAFLIFSNPVYSQILDDSTKLVYGPTTTRYVMEDDILNNVSDTNLIDTSLTDFHNYDFLYKGKSVYQNLGNLGTPLHSIYYTPAQTIGKTFGFNSFDPYAIDPYKVKYYDTRSPYTSIYYLQGVNGQQLGIAEFSRNIKPNWNVGFEIRRMTTNKLIGASSLRDRLADHTSFLFFTRFFTNDSSYQVLANYTFMDHKNHETGGVRRDSTGETNETFFDYREENVNLSTARSFEKRSAFHLYHQLSLPRKEYIQAYHIFDFYTQSNRFRANFLTDNIFYPDRPFQAPRTYFSPILTDDRTDFRLIENKAGLKGVLGDAYYRAYYRRKDIAYQYYYPSQDSVRSFNENFIGGNVSYRFSETVRINGSAEYLLSSNYLAGGERDYSIKGEFVSPYLTGGFTRMHHSPTLLQLKYLGNNLQWDHLNDNTFQFKNTTSDNLYVRGDIKWKFFTFNPAVNFSNIENYIFYNTLARPAQFSNTLQVVSLDLLLKFKWRWFNFENFIKYSNVSDPEIIRVPEIYNHSRIYYENSLFKKAILVQLGVDLFWRSEYNADYYMPITQQFYLNNSFPVESYLIGDVFLNLQIKRVNGFVKLSHFNQGLVDNGYFSTPYYPGLPRNLEFGLSWIFFN